MRTIIQYIYSRNQISYDASKGKGGCSNRDCRHMRAEVMVKSSYTFYSG